MQKAAKDSDTNAESQGQNGPAPSNEEPVLPDDDVATQVPPGSQSHSAEIDSSTFASSVGEELAVASTASTPLLDWRDSALRSFLDLKNYWKDRRTILNDPTTVRERTKLTCRPFAFALTGLIVPSLFVGLIYSAVRAIYPLRPTQIDRAIEVEKHLQSIADEALHEDWFKVTDTEAAWTKTMSGEQLLKEQDRIIQRLKDLKGKKKRSKDEENELTVLHRHMLEAADAYINRVNADLPGPLIALQKETAENQLKLLIIKKSSDIVESWQTFIISATLVLAAYVFAWWIRRLKPPPSFSSTATDAYLYVIGANLLFPCIVAAFLNVGLDLAIRYDKDWFLRVHPFLTLALGCWSFYILWQIGKMLSSVLESPNRAAATKSYRRVTWCLFCAQLTTGVMVQLGVAALSFPVLWTVWKLQQ
jgi:hypothetical protein